MCVNAVVMATKALVVITMRHQLTALRYVDDSGQAHAMTFRVLIQVLDFRLHKVKVKFCSSVNCVLFYTYTED